MQMERGFGMPKSREGLMQAPPPIGAIMVSFTIRYPFASLKEWVPR
jgi:hypothetical protein